MDDAGQVGFPEAAAALVRGRQVVVAGDRRRLPPATGGPSVLEVVAGLAGVHRLVRDHRTRDGRLLGPLLARYAGWVTTPGAAARSPLEFEHVREGTGVPAPGEDVAVSADAEVQRVVDLVTEHAVRRPGESLLVVTLGIRHATRIEEALRAEVVHNPELRRWLDVHWTGGISEPFLVRPVHRIAGLERDAVLVTVGLARTPHGRVLHRFGVLDGRHGQACLVAALTRARRRTTVVCAFRAEDIAAERVRSDGARLLRDVLDVAADPHARGEHGARLATAAGECDALVADLARPAAGCGVAGRHRAAGAGPAARPRGGGRRRPGPHAAGGRRRRARARRHRIGRPAGAAAAVVVRALRLAVPASRGDGPVLRSGARGRADPAGVARRRAAQPAPHRAPR